VEDVKNKITEGKSMNKHIFEHTTQEFLNRTELKKIGRPYVIIDKHIIEYINEHKEFPSRVLSKAIKKQFGKNIHYNTIIEYRAKQNKKQQSQS